MTRTIATGKIQSRGLKYMMKNRSELMTQKLFTIRHDDRLIVLLSSVINFKKSNVFFKCFFKIDEPSIVFT